MRLLSIILASSMLVSYSEASVISINPDDTYQVAPDGNCQKQKPKINLKTHHTKEKRSLKKAK